MFACLAQCPRVAVLWANYSVCITAVLAIVRAGRQVASSLPVGAGQPQILARVQVLLALLVVVRRFEYDYVRCIGRRRPHHIVQSPTGIGSRTAADAGAGAAAATVVRNAAMTTAAATASPPRRTRTFTAVVRPPSDHLNHPSKDCRCCTFGTARGFNMAANISSPLQPRPRDSRRIEQ
jgi:hypothetical protein